MAKVGQTKSKLRLTRARARQAAAYALQKAPRETGGAIKFKVTDRERFLGHFGSVGAKRAKTKTARAVSGRTMNAG
jgi:hypothetical protein